MLRALEAGTHGVVLRTGSSSEVRCMHGRTLSVSGGVGGAYMVCLRSRSVMVSVPEQVRGLASKIKDQEGLSDLNLQTVRVTRIAPTGIGMLWALQGLIIIMHGTS